MNSARRRIVPFQQCTVSYIRIVNVIIYIIVEIVAASYRNVFRHEEVAFLGQWLETPGFSWKGGFQIDLSQKPRQMHSKRYLPPRALDYVDKIR